MSNAITIASSAASATYGNVGCVLKEIVLSKFPPNFFRYINVSSELAFRNMRRLLGYNTNKEFYKRQKPYLIIKPTYSNNPDVFRNDTPLIRNMDNIDAWMDPGSLFNLMKDRENNTNLQFRLNRDRIDFDIVITVSTLHHQLDAYKALLNVIAIDRPYSHNAALEAMLPRSMMSYLGRTVGLDIDKSRAKIPAFLKYINSTSKYPITYKMRNSSASDEFFMYYNSNLLVTFTDLSLEDGNKKNMVDDSYNITFRVSVDFNLPGLFVLSGNNDTELSMSGMIAVDNDESQKEYIPLFSINNFYARYPSYKDGMKQYATSIFNVEDHSNGIDTLDISPLFDDVILDVLKENIKMNLPIQTLINVYILKDSTELVHQKEWTIDFNTMQVAIKNLDERSTYRIIIYINNIMINDKIEEKEDLNKKDMSKI